MYGMYLSDRKVKASLKALVINVKIIETVAKFFMIPNNWWQNSLNFDNYSI